MAVSTPMSSAPRSSSASVGRSSWRDFDWLLLFLVLALAVWGCFTIYSATRPSDEAFVAAPNMARTAADSVTSHTSNDATKQGIWIAVGLAAIFLLARTDYQFLMHLQGWIYGGNLFLLALVLMPKIGKLVNGARSWIPIGPFLLQPAEFCKVAVIICLAAFLCRRQDKIQKFSTLMWSLAYIALPMLLILKQPDFGTMLTILSIWLGMLFFGGARLRHIGIIVACGVALFVGAWKGGVLKEHQKTRLAVFLDRDPSPKAMREGGWQIQQSQIAIGAGQITGQGWGKGMQNRSRFVPENTTDFVFTVVAEELGFVGSALLMLLYLVLLLRTASTAIHTDNYFGVLIAGGFTALIGFHCIENLGMTMRVMPITGVPLPFFSYGGSSFIAFSMCVGLLQSISLRRRRVTL